MMDRDLSQFVDSAKAGSREALECLLEAIQDKVYGLCVRMLWHPEDARDATQEILIRIMTHLGTFRGDSSFQTWVYRVAANYFLDVRRSRLEAQGYTFERFKVELDENLAGADPDPADALLLEEIKVGCTLGMLLCLDRPHRLAYILGDILELDHNEAAAVLEITAAAYRKRLSRARADLVAFLRSRCGLFEQGNACRCRRRLPYALEAGRIHPARLLFASNRERAAGFPAVLAEIRRLEEDRRAAALYRSHPALKAPYDFVAWIRERLSRYSSVQPES